VLAGADAGAGAGRGVVWGWAPTTPARPKSRGKARRMRGVVIGEV